MLLVGVAVLTFASLVYFAEKVFREHLPGIGEAYCGGGQEFKKKHLFISGLVTDLPPSFSWAPGGSDLLKYGLKVKVSQKSSENDQV